MLKGFTTLKMHQQIGFNIGFIVSKMNNAKSLMIGMKPKDAITLDIFKLGKSEAYPKKTYYLK